MPSLRGWLHRLRVWLRGERYARDQQEEVAFHVALERMHQEHAGLAPGDARLAARRRFGNESYYREAVRRAAGLAPIDAFRQDLTYTLRAWKRTPGLAVTVIVTFALGVGANAAILSFLDRFLLRPPLGVVTPERVYRLYATYPDRRVPGGEPRVADRFSYPAYLAIRDGLRGQARVAARLWSDSVSLDAQGVAATGRREYVTADYLPMLLRRPALGRFFVPDEDDVDAPSRVAVLAYRTWQRVFAGDTAIIGRRVEVNSERFVIVGIAPPGFSGIDAQAIDLWVPASSRAPPEREAQPWYKRHDVFIQLLARTADGTPPARIEAAATLAYRPAYFRDGPGDTSRIVFPGPLLRDRGPMARPQELSIALRMAGVSVVVLLIACANIANLLLARAAQRRREISVRLALGVSRARLLRQLLIESTSLALIAAAAAVWVAAIGGSLLRTQLLPRIRWAEPVLDLRVVAVTLGVALLCGIVAGVAPSVVATRTDVSSALKGRGREGAFQRSRLRSSLLVAQAALSVILLAGAGLFLRSLVNVRAIDPGFDVERLVVGDVYFRDERRHPELLAQMAIVAARLAESPMVEAATPSSGAPMTSMMSLPLTIPGLDSIPRVGGQSPQMLVVSPAFFAITGMRLLSGRAFLPSDGPGGPFVTVVSRTMARTLWPGEEALGKCLIYGAKTNPCVAVIGIVDDLRLWRVTEEPLALYFLPLTQRVGSPNPWLPRQIIARAASGKDEAVATMLRQELRRAFPTAVPSARPLAQALGEQYRPWRLGASLFAGFALLALVVAAIGVYGVISYTFSQRTHELGVRMALGARTTNVVRLVLSSGVRLVGVGVLIGVAGALAAGRLVESLLYGLTARDPVTLVGAPLALFAVGALATLPAAWRAARVDPAVVLRNL